MDLDLELIAADHGDSRVNRWWRENSRANRLGLHCIGLALTLPSGERLDVSSPLFEDQHAVFEQMPWWNEAIEREPRLTLPPLEMWPPEVVDQSQVGARVYPIHRPDNQASACLLFAKVREQTAPLHTALPSEDTVKT